ncbi:MAG: DUF3189 family protein [Syntrophomonadaceae bacterium]|nr:DUF3189 family protein [Syntrophomonadaceae bacterium]
MKVIYHCFGGSHSSVTAAAIHLGILPPHSVPDTHQLLSLPYYDKTPGNEYGKIRFVGVSSDGHQVYVLGKENLGDRMNEIFYEIGRLLDLDNEFVAVNTMPSVNIFMMLGGYLSRRLGLARLGRPILVFGTRLAFPRLVEQVKATQINMT